MTSFLPPLSNSSGHSSSAAVRHAVAFVLQPLTSGRDFLALIRQTAVSRAAVREAEGSGGGLCVCAVPGCATENNLVITHRRAADIASVISSISSFFALKPVWLCFFRHCSTATTRKERRKKKKKPKTACVQRDITLLKAKQTCVSACPVISLLTCALTVGIWDPGNDGGR